MAEYYGNHNTSKQNNVDTLQAGEWNNLAGDVNKLVQAVNNNGEGIVSTQVDPTDLNKTFVKINDVTVGELTSKGDKGTNVSLSGNNNINIEPRPAAGTGEDKNTPGLTNRKGGNIAFKPGDDIEFWAHKRGTNKNDEVSVKIMTEVPKANDPTKTDEVAAKLQLNTADMVLTSKDKQEDQDVMNITVNRDTDTRGYLKVRAQAIDLRCEEHGGIALQPKGTDGQGNENKIKFEHGGGDGLEFATFNTEKTSIFTDEYRFNRDGVWKMATRSKVVSDKYDNNDETTHYKYVKQNDDFYDVIDSNDVTVTTADIINSAKFYYDNDEALDSLVDNQQNINLVISSLNNSNINTKFNYLSTGGLFIDTQKGNVTKLTEDSQDNWPTSYNLSGIGVNGVLNQDFNIVLVKAQQLGNRFKSSSEAVNYSEINSYLVGTKFLNHIGEEFYGSFDNGFVESEDNALRKSKPTLLFISTDDDVSSIVSTPSYPSGYIEELLGYSKVIYKVEKIANAQKIRICGNVRLHTSAGECNGEDIVALVNYFKNNHEGPWTN